jgi:hypothetical protein
MNSSDWVLHIDNTGTEDPSHLDHGLVIGVAVGEAFAAEEVLEPRIPRGLSPACTAAVCSSGAGASPSPPHSARRAAPARAESKREPRDIPHVVLVRSQGHR